MSGFYFKMKEKAASLSAKGKDLVLREKLIQER